MASRGVNKVILVGNLGQKPEVKFFPNGGSLANTTLATSETWKDKQTGEQKEATEWHRIIFRDPLAAIASEYLDKGSKVYIEGKLRTRKWQNQQGQDQYTTEIVVNEMQMLDSKPKQPEQPEQQGYQQTQQPRVNPAYAQGTNAKQPNPRVQQLNPQQPAVDFDDDIPFAPIGLSYNSMMIHCI